MTENITLLSYKDLEKAGYGSHVTIWRRIKEDNFPKPLSIDGKKTSKKKWRESEIIEWLEAQPRIEDIPDATR